MKKVVFFTLALLIFTSCTYTVPYRVIKNFKYCFNGENTGLDTLINIKGYYAPDTIIRPSNYIRYNGILTLHKDTLYPNYLFYDNGFVLRNVSLEYYNENIKKAFFYERLGVNPGGYRLYGDTIKLQCVASPGGQSREIAEIWFKIIDRNTIQRLSVRNESLQPSAEIIYIFRPLETRPNPESSWIYNKSWFRCKKK